MTRSKSILAGLALAPTILLSACVPAERVAQPDLIMKSSLSPDAMAPCLAMQLGRQFGDRNPDIKLVADHYEIAINAPRGNLIGFVTVEARDDLGSRIYFYNGDLYWPDRQTSGVYPDIARDNRHRAERAFDACEGANSAKNAG